jgi:mycothiol synthase
VALNVEIGGVLLRPLRSPQSDYGGMAAANQRARDAAGIEEVVTAEALARDYEHLVNCDLSRDLLVAERDGAIVGYCRVEWRDLENGGRTFAAVALLDPATADEATYGAMFAWAEDRLADKARAIPIEYRRPSAMRVYTFATDRAQMAVLEATGWTRTGQGYEMVRPTLDDVPEVPMPEGLVVRPIGLDEASRRRVWDALTEAFADERDEAEPTDEDVRAWLSDPKEDPVLWVVAFDGDEIAGGVHGKIDPAENAHHGRDRGVLDAVWTRRRWRRRGLARALIARALIRLRDHGMTSAYLGVDGLNPNQAMTLYTSLGFDVASTAYDWTKSLPLDAAPPLDDDRPESPA